MRVMLITEADRERIAAIRAHAGANILPLARTWRISHGHEPPIRLHEGNSLMLPVNFRVAYCIEEQPAGRYEHLSVSIMEPGACPHPVEVQMLLSAFGMPGLEECEAVYPRRQPDGRGVINVLTKMREQPA